MSTALLHLTMSGRAVVHMTVFLDAVKLETEDCGRRDIVGWFRDEVSALGAVTERVLMRSAILSCLRQLPEMCITSEYKPEFAKRDLLEFKRATKMKVRNGERRVVLRPGMFGKTWIVR